MGNIDALVTYGLPGRELFGHDGIYTLRSRLTVDEVEELTEELYNDLEEIPGLSPKKEDIELTYSIETYETWNELKDQLEDDDLDWVQGVKTRFTGEFGEVEVHYNPISEGTAFGGISSTKAVEVSAEVQDEQYFDQIEEVVNNWGSRNGEFTTPSL